MGNFRLRIDSEFLICTSRPGDTMTVLRGQDGTTAASHKAGALVLESDASGAIVNAVEAGVPADGVSDATSTIQGLINSVSAAGGGRIVFPAGTYLLGSVSPQGLVAANGVDLHLMKGAWLQKNYSAAGGFADALVRNPVSGGVVVSVSGFAITGEGKLGCPSLSLAGDIVSIYGDDSRFEGITVDTYGGGDSSNAGGQAFIVGGSRIRMLNVVVRNAPVAGGTGGIRMIGGTDFVVVGCHVESGDDALQFVPAAQSVGGVANQIKNVTITRSTYIGCTGFSSAGRFMVVELADPAPTVPTGPMTAGIRECSFIGCHGSGTLRRLVVNNSASSGQIRDIAFADCSVGSYPRLGALHAAVGLTDTSIQVDESAVAVPSVPFPDPSRRGADDRHRSVWFC
jgi:hypothetical protein